MESGYDAAATAELWAGIIFIGFVTEFVIAMILGQLYYPCTNGVCYSITSNPISDLGNTAKSPLWPLLNYSVYIRGSSILLGTALVSVAAAFGRSRLTMGGLGLLVVVGLAAGGLAAVPENTIYGLHLTFAAIGWISAAVALILLGLSMRHEPRWKSYATYTLITGIWIVVFFFVLGLGGLPSSSFQWATTGPGFGFGALERLTEFPQLVWFFVIGVTLVRAHTGVRAASTAAAPS